MLNHDVRHFVGPDDRIVHHRAGQQLASLVVFDFLEQADAQPLRDATDDLTLDDGGLIGTPESWATT